MFLFQFFFFIICDLLKYFSAKLRGEVEFLHGAFESYKSQLHADTDEKWRKHEKEILERHEQELQKQIQDIRK